ncbi:hypothetical protein M0804_001292 [Polistes exclamans]|nr:hypothetical protein M0804_001292 [Polistes exclamans]
MEEESFNQKELEYLSLRLNPLECLQLIKIMNASMKYIPDIQTTRILRGYSYNDGITNRDCLIGLENWNHNYLGANTHLIICVCYKTKGEENSNIRETMDLTLRTLGRPDLAKYITRSRNIKSFNAIIKGQTHLISKRNSYKSLEKTSFDNEKEKNERMEENCTNEIHENQHNVSPIDEKKTSQEKQANENKQVIDTNGSSTNMRWLNLFFLLGFFFVVTCIILLCITRKWKRAKLMNGRSIHLEEKGKSNGCTCNCSDVDIESGSLDHYSPKYHRGRRNDQDKSRILLKKKKKEKTKDRNYFDSCIKTSSKIKEKRKKHKRKRKSVKMKNFDEGKLDRKRTRSSTMRDYKNYPICDCCKCTADYK